MKGSSWLVFVSLGTCWQLLNPAELSGQVGAEVTVTGRAVERSPYAAHVPGPTLWIERA